MGIMKMTTIQNENRTGIYVQKSAGATTAGDGLALERDKSPVAYKKDGETYVILSDDDDEQKQDYPHCSGLSETFKTIDKPPATSYQSKPPEKFDDKYRNKAPSSLKVRTREERNLIYKKAPAFQFYVSPAVKAGATEADSSYSPQGIKRKALSDRQDCKDLRINGMYVARRRMGMRGSHIRRRYSSGDGSPTRTKEEEFPIEVQVINKANPFGEIDKVNQILLMCGLETTVQDERFAGNFVKLGPLEYKKRILVVPCKNEVTVRFLENNIQSYNRLWPGADLKITREPIVQKRYKVRVHLPNYNITSEEFFKIFGKQNNYPSKYWSLLNRRRADGFIAFIGVDFESYTRLKQANGQVYFFFEKIELGLDCK